MLVFNPLITPYLCSGPTITAQPTGYTTANVTVTPPSLGGPWASYNLTLCPAAGGACINTTCVTPANCPFTDLTPNSTYRAQAWALKSNGVVSPPSNIADVTLPPLPPPVLTVAAANNATTGTTTAQPPSNVTYILVSEQREGGGGLDLGE